MIYNRQKKPPRRIQRIFEGRSFGKYWIEPRENKPWPWFVRHLDDGIGLVSRNLITPLVKVDRKKILVMTFTNAVACNPKYVVLELLRENVDCEIVWVTNEIHINEYLKLQRKYQSGELEVTEENADMIIFKDTRVRFVVRGTFSHFFEQASACVWLDNALNCVWHWMPKKKNQTYFQFWHGSLGIKRIDSKSQPRRWLARAKQLNKKTDLCCVNSRFEEDVFKNSHWPDVAMLYTGHARNDMFFDAHALQVFRRKVCRYYGLQGTEKLLLYAPTFRTDFSMDFMDADFDSWTEALSQRFGGEWKILVRFHFQNHESVKHLPDSVLDACEYPDMQELMAASDIGVSDYSSWVFDYMLMGRPCFLYATDIREYENDRGFYYPLSTTPFPIADCNEAMVQQFLSFDEETYRIRTKEFLEEKGCMEDGKAAARIAEKVRECLGDK